MGDERYPYWPLPDRPTIRWPEDARVALWVSPNVEHFLLEQPTSTPETAGAFPDVPNIAKRDYGPRIGVWRLMEVLDRHAIRATVALNADVCRRYPQIIEAGRARNWEWMGHGITNSRRLSGLAEEDERRVIKEVRDTITASTGRAPVGWLGPGLVETTNTLDLLAEAGFTYVADWCSDEQPFPMRVKSGTMITVPYSQEVNDFGAFMSNAYTPREFYDVICDQFDVLYEEGEHTGRVMAIALHPFLSGHPFRAKWLDKALAYITSHDRVWKATGSEIADWYYKNLYERVVAHAE